MLMAMQTHPPVTECARLGLFGLGDYAPLSPDNVFALLRPMLPSSITDQEVRDVIGRIDSKYVVVKANVEAAHPDVVEADITAAIVAALGVLKAGWNKADISKAFDTLSQNYSIIERASVSTAPASSGQGSSGVVADSINAAANAITSFAVAFRKPPKQKKQKVVRRNWTPWIAGGIGITLLGAVLVATKRK